MSKSIQSLGAVAQDRLFRLALTINFSLIIVNIVLWISSFQQNLSWRADFTAFYTAARMMLNNAASDLYNFTIQEQFQSQLLAGKSFAGGLLPFNYPPHVAILLTPLGFLNLEAAYLAWTFIQLIISVYLCRLLLRICSDWETKEYLLLICLVLASPFFLLNLLLGSFSLLMLVASLHFIEALRKDNQLACAIALIVGSIKPQIWIIPIIILIAAKKWKTLGFASIFILLIMATSSIFLGISAWIDYFDLMLRSSTFFNQFGIYPGEMINLKGFLTILLGIQNSSVINVICFAALMAGLIATFWIFKYKSPSNGQFLEAKLALYLFIAIIVSPHTNPQDGLLVAAPALLLYKKLRVGYKKPFCFTAIISASPLVLTIHKFAFLQYCPLQPIFFITLWMSYLSVLLISNDSESSG